MGTCWTFSEKLLPSGFSSCQICKSGLREPSGIPSQFSSPRRLLKPLIRSVSTSVSRSVSRTASKSRLNSLPISMLVSIAICFGGARSSWGAEAPNTEGSLPSSARSEESGKSDAGKSDSGKSDSGKSDSGKIEAKKTDSGKTSRPAAKKGTKPVKEEESPEEKARKLTVTFPVVSPDSLPAFLALKPIESKQFPDPVSFKGTKDGVLMSGNEDTRYDLFSSTSVWLDFGALLISVRQPTELVMIATKYGDICVEAGGDVIVDISDGLMRVSNFGTKSDTVYLNIPEKHWQSSPWSAVKNLSLLPDQAIEPQVGGKSNAKFKNRSKKGEKPSLTKPKFGVLCLAPGYEFIMSDHALTLGEVEPADSIGRRDFKTFEGAKHVVSEFNLESLVQSHELIKGLKDHGGKALGLHEHLIKIAHEYRAKQGEGEFHKYVPPPPKVPAKAVPTKSKPASKPGVMISAPKKDKATPEPKASGSKPVSEPKDPGPKPAK